VNLSQDCNSLRREPKRMRRVEQDRQERKEDAVAVAAVVSFVGI
jgi:hypothetical protein